MSQDSCNSGTRWYFINIQIIEVIDKLASGCTIKPPHNNKTRKIKMLGCVDNKRYYVNLLLQNIKELL